MKMPEGYARLKWFAQEDRFYKDEKPTIESAIQLLEEMAEALERVNEYGSFLEKSMRRADILKVKQALNKFLEWK